MSFNVPEIEATVLSLRHPTTDFNIDIKNTDGTPLTADRDLSLNVCDADRTLSICGDVAFNEDLTTTSIGAIILAAFDAGGSNVTLPSTGTILNTTETQTKIDMAVQGLDIKESVRCTTSTDLAGLGTGYAYNNVGGTAATGQITWTADPGTIDSIVVLADGDRILVMGNTNPDENGIWVRTSSTVWDRAVDFDGVNGDVSANAYTWVEEGTVSGDQGYVLTTNDPITVGTGAGSNLVFAHFTGAGQITAGDGIDKTGNVISADLKANGGLVIETSEIAVDLSASNITGTLAVPDGGTGVTTFTTGTLLEGNGAGAVTSSVVATNVVTQTASAGSDNLVPKYVGASKTIEASGVAISDSNIVSGVQHINMTGHIRDTNGNELIGLSSIGAGAVNEVTVANSITGNAPALCATGSDNNIDIDLKSKGTGDINAKADIVSVGGSGTAAEIRLQDTTGGDYVGIKAASATTTYTVIMPDAQGASEEILKNDGSGNLSWAAFGGVNARHFQVSSFLMKIKSTNLVDVAYFPWKDSLYGGATAMKVTVFADAGVSGASSLVVTGSTLTTITVTIPAAGGSAIFFMDGGVPTADELLTFSVSRTMSSDNPNIYGITIDLT